ncbi:DUF3592 domain-containing protein [Herbidospora sp. NBRC 101105]|uniref:DUF3592 domain-containing protein n=1 Tax=Herbidospora sp. NBRC 101105 TaxID=3032195 RepID=UPI0024A18569|nr:DUF3592 domain-containing protein [Herbidospora sp. NBRC 101105]GLX92886.1 hypothetical protein Hesp01_08360 [Herbidospora sp. NBRC 101105]
MERILLGLILEFVGLHLLAQGQAVRRAARAFLSTAVRAEGEVIALLVSRAGVSQRPRPSHVYLPVLRFRTAEGTLVEARSPVGGNPAPAAKGDRVGVLYDPADPRDVRIDTVTGHGTTAGRLLTALGAAVLVVAVGVVVSGVW